MNTKKSPNISDIPVEINEHNWYYEEKNGIAFVHENYGGRDGKTHLSTDVIKIPWSKLVKSMRRCKPELF